MLLTHVQVIKAAQIYKILQEMEKSEEVEKLDDRGLFRNLSPESLLEYISNLPEEIIEKLDTEKTKKQNIG